MTILVVRCGRLADADSTGMDRAWPLAGSVLAASRGGRVVLVPGVFVVPFGSIWKGRRGLGPTGPGLPRRSD